MRAPARPRRSRSALFLALLLVAAAEPAAAADAPEPAGYWTGPLQGDVPATLARGHVVHTDALAALLAREAPVLIDVALRPHRPSGLAPQTVWKPAPHRDIAGSAWLPGSGAGALDPALEQQFAARLATLTGGNFDKPIVVYCHAHCWASWNAAKRAINLGYRDVYWYPDGAEAWQDAGHELAVATDDGPHPALPHPALGMSQ